MDIRDVIITTYTNNSKKLQMTLTHEPTMTIVNGEGDHGFTLKVKLMQELIKKVKDNG